MHDEPVEQPSQKPGTQSVSMDLGLPVTVEHLVTVFGSQGVPLGPPTGSPGKYRGFLTLYREGFRPIPEYEVTQGAHIKGDSHLAMAKPAYAPRGNEDARHLEMDLTTDRGEHFVVVGEANDRGFLGKIEVKEFDAASFDDAHEKVIRASSVMLSNLSVQLAIPLMVFQTDLHEVSTNSHWMAVVNPYFEIPPVIASEAGGGQEFRAFASMYREALDTNSALYRYLCLYKITEGIRKKRKAKEREATKLGKTYTPPQEVVPGDSSDFVPWLNCLYLVAPKWTEMHLEAIFRKDAVGRAFLDLIGDERPATVLRNEIGHAFTSSSGKEVINLDNKGSHSRVQSWLPLLKCMARRMMRNEFPTEFLSWFNDKFRSPLPEQARI